MTAPVTPTLVLQCIFRYHGGMTQYQDVSRLARVWGQMLERCYDPDGPKWLRYGGRGIKVCPEWHSCDTFISWALAHGYRQGLQIDRKNNDGNYEPGNCWWVTCAVNSRNKSTNRWITINGETRCLTDWENDPRCTITSRGVWLRLKKGWDPELALFTPSQKTRRKGEGVSMLEAFGETKTLLDWSKDPRCKVNYDTLKERINRSHWPVEDALTQPKQRRVALRFRDGGDVKP